MEGKGEENQEKNEGGNERIREGEEGERGKRRR